jgi:NADPH-dependent ferric siderophore reductase
MLRLTLRSAAFADFAVPLPAQWVKVVLAPPEALVRPNRSYTIRRIDPVARRLEIDFALHADGGPLSSWAAGARVGDTVHLGIPRGGFSIDRSAPWFLLGGDETALPAIESILAALPDGPAPVDVFVEIPGMADARPIATGDNRRVIWLPRDDSRHGVLLQAALEGAALRDGPGQVFLAGEAKAIQVARSSISARAPGAQVKAAGYWRLGTADHRD